MKRLLTASAAALGLAFAAPAAADTTPWAGNVEEGGSVTFDLVTKHGKPRRVKDFSWFDVPEACMSGPEVVSGGPLPSLLLFRDDKFRYDAQLTEETTKVVGQITTKHHAKGTLRFKTTPGGGDTDCDTGKVHWKANNNPL